MGVISEKIQKGSSMRVTFPEYPSSHLLHPFKVQVPSKP